MPSPADPPRFSRPRRSPSADRRLRWMAAGLLLVAGLLALRRWRASVEPPLPAQVVQVVGEVPVPGWYEIDGPTVAGALAAAGVERPGDDARPVPAGWRVAVRGGRAVMERQPHPLVFGLPIDLNVAGVEALQAIPGIGPSLAARIVEERERSGPYRSVEDLVRVRGIGPATVRRIAPFVEAGGER